MEKKSLIRARKKKGFEEVARLSEGNENGGLEKKT